LLLFLNKAGGIFMPENISAAIILAIYLLFQTFIFAGNINLVKADIIFTLFDISFVTWALYKFDDCYFLVFYFLILFSFGYGNGLKKSIIPALSAIVLFYLVSVIKIVQLKTSFDNIIIQLSLYPSVILSPFCFIKIINEIKKKKDSEFLELVEQNKIKNDILSTLSHELRTPLTMIKTSADIMLEERPGKINGIQKNFLDIISDNVYRLINLVEDILSKIKIETAWLRLELKPIDIRSLIKKIVTNMKPIIEQKKQGLKFTHPKIVSKAIADKNWMQQVMINLINNSSKNIGENDQIIVSIKENEQYIIISVSDNGCGIENDKLTTLLEDNNINNDSFLAAKDSFGFGLSIVKNVVERHNGKIYMSSVPEIGTTFSFTLPKKEGGHDW
jgi:signal transduction histidine kinase